MDVNNGTREDGTGLKSVFKSHDGEYQLEMAQKYNDKQESSQIFFFCLANLEVAIDAESEKNEEKKSLP